MDASPYNARAGIGARMTTLRDHVAAAIARDEDAGGANVLRIDEVHALEEASILLRRAGDPHGADTLLNLVHEMGPAPMFIDGPLRARVDEYHHHFADIAIGAYDEWFDQRQKQKMPR